MPVRLYAHLLLATGCMAPGCQQERTDLYRAPGGMVRACCYPHALAADEALRREDEERERRKAA